MQDKYPERFSLMLIMIFSVCRVYQLPLNFLVYDFPLFHYVMLAKLPITPALLTL